MSSGISQIKYWREGEALNNNNNNNNTKEGSQAIYLSYDVFLGLTVLGGFFALDHLYLRSPLTAVAKFFVNIFCFGLWWLYDASQALFNREAIKVYGLGVPMLGPKGIAAGVLAKDEPDKKHMKFFIYGICLFFGGMFGLDSFLVGNNRSGFIRLISLISGIFAPIAIIWWIYKLGLFFFSPTTTTGKYYKYFGAPPGEQGLLDKLLKQFPFLAFLFDPMGIFMKFFQTFLEPFLGPFQSTIDHALDTTDSVVATAKDGIALGNKALNTAGTVIDSVKETVDKAVRGVGTIPAAGIYGLTSPNAIQKAQESLKEMGVDLSGSENKGEPGASGAREARAQAGGAVAALIASNVSNESNILPYTLLGSIAFIVTAGFALTYYRSKKHGTPQYDDTPPEPGVLRESDQKERTPRPNRHH